jgi:hypothetical protein
VQRIRSTTALTAWRLGRSARTGRPSPRVGAEERSLSAMAAPPDHHGGAARARHDGLRILVASASAWRVHRRCARCDSRSTPLRKL